MLGSQATIDSDPQPVSPPQSQYVYPVEPSQIAILTWYGVSMAYSIQLAYRCVIRKVGADNQLVRVGKCSLGVCMFTKAVFFAALSSNHINDCTGVVRAADFFYQFAMVSGNAVLLLRVQAIIPPEWSIRSRALHVLMVVVRLAFGIVAVALVSFSPGPQGKCLYKESGFWGPVYTFYDTFTDLYVTIMIAYMLTSHIKHMRQSFVEVNISTYLVFIAQNVIRTTILTIANGLSALFMITSGGHFGIMILWAVTNTLVVLLIGYDVDLARVVHDMQLMVTHPGGSHPPLEDEEQGAVYGVRLSRPQTVAVSVPGVGDESTNGEAPKCKSCGSRAMDVATLGGGVGGGRRMIVSTHHSPQTPSFLSDPSRISAILDSDESSRSPSRRSISLSKASASILSACDLPRHDVHDFSPTSTLPTPELKHLCENGSLHRAETPPEKDQIPTRSASSASHDTPSITDGSCHGQTRTRSI